MAALAFLAIGASSAIAQFPDRIRPGVRVRVWLPEQEPQENAPWRRQLLRGTVGGVEDDVLRVSVPGTEGTLAVARSGIRRIDVSLGRNRGASAFERAVEFGALGALWAGLLNDPGRDDWPSYNSDWRAAGYGAIGGAVAGAVVGLVFPTERWRRVKLPGS
jgi:hypothetical protein